MRPFYAYQMISTQISKANLSFATFCCVAPSFRADKIQKNGRKIEKISASSRTKRPFAAVVFCVFCSIKFCLSLLF